MTNPLPANAHANAAANAAVTERELSFDALVAEFGQPEADQRPEPEPKAKPAREPKAKTARESNTMVAPAREPKAKTAREPKTKSAADTKRARQPRRTALQLPDAETLKLLGLVVVVVISSTLAAVALTR